MRQRRPKNLEERLGEFQDILVSGPGCRKGHWKETMNCSGRLFAEIGCGKGQFITARALAAPDDGFVGIEGQRSVLLRACEKLRESEITNVRLIGEFVNDPQDFFEEGELDGIYLNFSDPWPKARHKKRRLTYRDRLRSYEKVLKKEGFIEFKTDNDELFAFTIEEVEACGYETEESTEDLHSSDFESRNFRTEYEDRFRKLGKKINYIRFRVS